MKVSIIGTGYVGLVSGACLAAKGHEVICVDVVREKVDAINRGEAPIHEKGLDALLKQVIGRNLKASTDLTASIMESKLSLIAVGTPFDGERIDLTYVRRVSREIGEVLRHKSGYHVVVVKSTLVPGTSEEVVLPLLEEFSGKKAGADFGVGMNPEFLKEGEAIADFMEPDRIVLGGIDTRTVQKLDELYAVFPDVEKVRTNPRTAEMIKYTANSLLATLISFSNEVANLCDAVGSVDIVEVMRGVHLDKRLSPILDSGERVFPASLSYLAAGCGFGGSCFPKDVKALIRYGRDRKQPMSILDAVVKTNQEQPLRMIDLARRHYPNLTGIRVAVLGVAFKPGTDDIRESPSLVVIGALEKEGAQISVFDPIVRPPAEKELGGERIDYADTMENCIRDAEVVFLMTSWPQFKELPRLLAELRQKTLLVDGRRMISRHDVVLYEGIGYSKNRQNSYVS